MIRFVNIKFYQWILGPTALRASRSTGAAGVSDKSARYQTRIRSGVVWSAIRSLTAQLWPLGNQNETKQVR